MLEHVYKRVALSKALDATYIATCDDEIRRAAENFGAPVIMTSDTHERASDRVAEAVSEIEAELIVMVQGDEPMTHPEMIDAAVEPFRHDPELGCVNLMRSIDNKADFYDFNTIKVVTNQRGDALFMSRQPIPTVPASIYGRFDWTKHWTLSAAISGGAGVQLSEAAGEWKELADSLSRQSQFAVGDPSGFSIADLAADRAGFQSANAAVEPDSAERVAAELAKATPEQLLPNDLVKREDGLTNAEFVRRYGGVDDPRFKARVREIDGVLAQSGLR